MPERNEYICAVPFASSRVASRLITRRAMTRFRKKTEENRRKPLQRRKHQLHINRSRKKIQIHVGLPKPPSGWPRHLQAAGSDRREFDCIPHQVPRIDEWAKALHQRFGSPIAIALELTKGPVVYALQKYDFFVLFPINPSTLAKYRVAFKPSRAKDDPTDAEMALDLLLHHPERFRPLQPQSVAMRTLLSLTEHRRELVDDKTRLTNRLTDNLKQYYPQVLDWFEQRDTILFCDFLSRWPTLLRACESFVRMTG
jgi:hypothetical protein